MKRLFVKICAAFMAVIILLTGDATWSFGTGLDNLGIGASIPKLLTPDEASGIVTTDVGPKVARFSVRLNLDALETDATYVPVTTVAALKQEIKDEARMTYSQLKAFRERIALIGTLGIVNVTRSLNVREEPSDDADIVGKIYQNSGVIIRNFSGENGEWMYVKSGSVQGWVVSKYIVTGEQADSLYEAMNPKVATTVCEAVAYAKASKDSTKTVDIAKGESFVVLGFEGDFVKVQLTASDDAYIHNDVIAVTEGLFAGKSLVAEEWIQDAIDLLIETRRIMAEKKKAEEEAEAEAERAAEAKRKAAETAKKKATVKTEEGWTYLGKFRVTFYCVDCNTPSGSRKTHSGATATEWHTCAVKAAQIPMGTTVKVKGFGEFVAEDTGVGYNQIDLFVSPDKCDGLYYRDVWIKN